MEKMKSMLDEIFNARVETVASISKEEQEKINEAKTKIEIKDAFENATDSEIKKIEELIDIAMENMSYEMGYFEEKYYKTGFADGVKLVVECMGRRRIVDFTHVIWYHIIDIDDRFLEI